MKKQFLFCSLLIFPFILFSCAAIQPVTIGGMENPKIHKLSREGIEAEFSIKIKNLNKMGVTVYPSEFEGTINDIPVGKINLTKKVRIKANTDETETFYINSDFSKLGLDDLVKVMPLIVSGRAAIYLKGNIRTGKWFYKKKFPIEMKKTISLPK